MAGHGKKRRASRLASLIAAVLVGTLVLLSGCEHDQDDDEVVSDALLVPAYPSMELESIANTVWSSCEWDKDGTRYLFRIWRFSEDSAEVEGSWHSDTDTDCSAAATGSIGRTQYTPLQDFGVVVAAGWRDQDGAETANGDAPQSADMLGALPGQPGAKRIKLLFKMYYGSGAVPLFPVYQLMFLDQSGVDTRLYVGSPVGTADVDGFPEYLNNYGVLTPYME